MLALLALFCICHHATSAADALEACQPPIKGTVSFKTSATYAVSSKCSLPVESVAAYRVWSKCHGACSDETRVQFVARGKKKISAWTLPYVPDSFSNLSFGRTYFSVPCEDGILQRDPEPLYIDVLTSSATPVEYTLAAEMAIPFKLSVSQSYSANVTRETPQIFYVEFSAEQTSLVVTVTSTAPRSCAWVSVQNTSGCSPHDSVYSAMSDSIFQTMTTTAILTIAKSELVKASFFVIIMLVNDSFCFNTWEYASEGFKTVEIIIQPASTASHFLGPIIGSAAVIIGIGLLLILVYCMYFHVATQCRCAVIGETRRDQNACCCNKCCPGCCSFWFLWCLVDYFCLFSSSSYFDDGVTCFYGCCKKSKALKAGSAGHNGNQEVQSAVRIEEMDESQLTVRHLSQNDYQQQKMQYATYAWNTVTVGIYYGIPALQLVLSQLNAADTDENLCYYNYKCATPLNTIIAFNNIWSNIGYIVLGIAFVIIVLIRQQYVKRRLRKMKKSAVSNELQDLPGSGGQKMGTDSATQHYGIPQHMGVYYAMGFALMIQGVMSGLYHICPTQTNFQFGLVIIAILQSRHADIKGKSFFAFFMFSLVTLITIVGLYLDKRNRSVVRGLLAIVVLSIVVTFLVSFFYFHHWKASLSSCYNPKTFLTNSLSIIKRRKLLMARLIVIFLINCAIITAFVITINSIPYVILYTFLANAILFFGVYIAFKCIHSETGFGPFLVVGACALVFLGLALYNFKQNTYNSNLTPAESREHNRPCIWFGFYGNHDVWHFYSALAVFFTLLALLVMDDGLTMANKPLTKIPVF